MVETTNPEVVVEQKDSSENGFLNLQFILKTFLLNWQWFVLSVVIIVGLALVYLRYTPPVYQVSAKVLVKDDEKTRSNNKIAAAANLGLVTNSDGFDNELELLKSKSLAEGVVRDLKIYVDYEVEGTVTALPMYGNNPVIVDMDEASLNKLETGAVTLEMKKKGDTYSVSGTCLDKSKVVKRFEKKGTLPMSIKTMYGVVTLKKNTTVLKVKDGVYHATLRSPEMVALSYAGRMSVSALTKTTTIASLVLKDQVAQRAIDYLKQVTVVYNRQANEDKNQIAIRTEQFINQRLEKINNELGSTDGAIENYKRQNNMIDAATAAGQAMTNTDATDKKLVDIQTQLLLLESVKDYMNKPGNKYQTLPSNIGLTDGATTALISQYNNICLNRNRLLHSASELSPTVMAITSQLDDIIATIRSSVDQNIQNEKIRRDAIVRQMNKYSGMITMAPQQERILTEIGRQQTVKSSLYIMLLQKREENSIELAATADKGKLIDEPSYGGKVSPKSSIILLVAFVLGIGFPFLIFVIMELLRFRIEGHEDVEKLTKCPIIADVAIANERAKTKGDIVVHENRNNQMEEIFRGMRTNIQFMLKKDQNVIMFTSSTSGEGKTFTASNLAVSFALLGKKVVLVGLDIRRPRLSVLFDINNEINGITPLLAKGMVSIEDVKEEIVPSGINKNLDLLMAGPVPPNPAELIASQTLEDIFAILRKEYDYVIVDTAPVGLVTDTLQLSRIADATIIVCRADYTMRGAFSLINDYAENEKLPNVSIVINGIDMSKKKYGFAYGYGKYGKYGKYGYGKAGKYGSSYYGYGYSTYGYGSYTNSHYSNPNDESIKQ